MSLRASELGGLADPVRFVEPVDVGSESAAVLRRQLASMLTIRFAEEAIGELVESGHARAPCHLGIGQEAIAVGVSAVLSANDRVFGGHRSHSHYLALGGDVYKLIAEVLGKEDGASRGMGGSMHLYDRSVGFYGSVPLVGATIPLAVGAGLAAKMDKAGAIGVTYFGDGAAEEGVFHESLNLAAAFALPVLFVCENNLFSSHLDIGLRQPSDRIARFGEAHRVPSLTVDGNDVVAVARATRELVDAARRGGGPGLLEAVTYRHRGHVGPKEDIDVGVHRRTEDLQAWKQRDPISRLAAGLQLRGMLSRDDYEKMRSEIRTLVSEATERAKAAPYPPQSALFDLVYARS
jgi:acetoin:2,6-dichlorophenolindophenol oxidoreductase subunit alpha